MIPAAEAARIIDRHRGDAVVVAASSALRQWAAVSSRRNLDVDMTDCMDKAADVALGISLARPGVKVLTLDTDATLRTNPNALITVGASEASNLVHILWEDHGHGSTGGTAIPGLGVMDFGALAKESGYAAALKFDNLEDFALSMEDILSQRGPVFVTLKVYHRDPLPPFPARSMQRSMEEVRKALAAAGG